MDHSSENTQNNNTFGIGKFLVLVALVVQAVMIATDKEWGWSIFGNGNGTPGNTNPSPDNKCGEGFFDYHGECLEDLHPKFILGNSRPYLSCGQYNEEQRILLEKKLEVVIENAGIGTRGAVVEAARFLAGFPNKVAYVGAKRGTDIGQYKHVGLNLGPGGWGCGNGLDCSDGYVGWTLTNAGFTYGAFKYGQAQRMIDVMDQVRPGDFAWVKDADGTRSHIGIVIGVDSNTVYVGESRGYGPDDGLQVTPIDKSTGSSHLAYVYINSSSYNGDGKYNDMWD